MAKYSVTTTLTTTPTGNVLAANGSHTTNVQVDATAYQALLQQLNGSFASVAAVQAAQTKANAAVGIAIVLGA